MLLLAGSITILGLLSVVSPSTSAAVVTEVEDPIAHLTRAVTQLVESETEIKSRLMEATNVLIDSQSALQKLLRGSTKGKTGETLSKEVVGAGLGDDESTRALAEEILIALREFKSNGNNTSGSRTHPVLQQILDELKNLNGNFKEHLITLSCPPPFVMIGNDCYNVLLEDMTWEDARTACLRMGSDLAQPSNITALKEYVGHRYPRKNRRNFWIGGAYQEKEWKWLSGDLLEDGFWHINEPSGNGNCLAMFDGWENPFTDFPCDNERRAICKRL